MRSVLRSLAAALHRYCRPWKESCIPVSTIICLFPKKKIICLLNTSRISIALQTAFDKDHSLCPLEVSRPFMHLACLIKLFRERWWYLPNIETSKYKTKATFGTAHGDFSLISLLFMYCTYYLCKPGFTGSQVLAVHLPSIRWRRFMWYSTRTMLQFVRWAGAGWSLPKQALPLSLSDLLPCFCYYMYQVWTDSSSSQRLKWDFSSIIWKNSFRNEMSKLSELHTFAWWFHISIFKNATYISIRAFYS